MAVMTFKQIEKLFHKAIFTYCSTTKSLSRDELSQFIDTFCTRHAYAASDADRLKKEFLWAEPDGKYYVDLTNPSELTDDVYLIKRRQKARG